MRFTINSLTRCAGQNHIDLSVSVNGGAARIVQINRDELGLDPDDLRTACLARIRSAVKEAGATTNAQVNTALVGKEFQV